MYNPLKVKSYYLLAALWIISSFANLSYAEPIYINELYSKSQGNNKYEAKIKAIDKSMTRAVILIADKMGFISGDNIASFRKIPAGKLRSIFNKMTIKNENTEEYPSGAKYSSIISFECESANLYELLKEYRNKGEKYNSPTLLIPIFKINKILYLDNDASGWIKEWTTSKTKLLDYNVVILQGPQYEQHDITGKNILSLNFKDLASRTPERIFDRVILSIGEFFTDKISGETLFSVEHITLTYSKKDTKKVTYKLNSAKNSFLELKKSIVSQFILGLGAPSAK